VLGGTAILLAVAGIYGVAAFAVNRRIKEFGMLRPPPPRESTAEIRLLRRAVSSMRPGFFYDLTVSACSVPSLLMSPLSGALKVSRERMDYVLVV
jgi:hypothetical protein